jgi:thioesterase domain-containing protein
MVGMQGLDLDAAKQLAIGMIPFIERTGVELLELEPGRLKAKMPFEPNINHIGTMYAGALYTLAEFPGGVVFFSIFDVTKYYPIIREQTIRFLRPATTDVTIDVAITQEEVDRISREIDEHGKANWTWEVELVDANGEVVATSTNHYQGRAHG